MRIDVRTEHEVTGIDLSARKAEVHNRAHGRTFQLGFDQLHVATGARAPPARPARPRPAARARGADPRRRRRPADRPEGLGPAPRRVVVIGSGYIGLEMAEAFVERGRR